MAELEMVRAVGDRKLYELLGIGSLRRPHWYSRQAIATALDSRRWSFTETGLCRPVDHATPEVGQPSGRFHRAKLVSRSGPLQWGDDSYELTFRSFWRLEGVLAAGGRDLLATKPGNWNSKRSRVQLLTDERLDPGLVLFVIWVVQLEQERSAAAASSSSS